MNLVGGQLVAVFGSADRYLARVDALLGDGDAAERHFAAALAMDRRMGSVVHVAETLAAHALAVHADRPGPGPGPRAQARALAEPIGQVRVLRSLEPVWPRPGPTRLTAREAEVLGLARRGPEQPGDRRAAVHQRQHRGQPRPQHPDEDRHANRTQAARYATEHQLHLTAIRSRAQLTRRAGPARPSRPRRRPGTPARAAARRIASGDGAS